MDFDYAVRLVNLPLGVNGMVIEDENGFYNIYINEKLNDISKISAFNHEIMHINNNDFAKEKASVFDNRFNR